MSQTTPHTEKEAAWPLDDPLAIGRRVLAEEAAALQRTAAGLGADFAATVQAVLGCRGRVVVSGVGKSGHVRRKIAATLASTGTPAFFVHAAEAGHGDLGMITAADVVLGISNSGESEELTAILPLIKRMGVPLTAPTGRANVHRLRHACRPGYGRSGRATRRPCRRPSSP